MFKKGRPVEGRPFSNYRYFTKIPLQFHTINVTLSLKNKLLLR